MKRFLIFVILGPIIGLAVMLTFSYYRNPDVRIVTYGVTYGPPLAYVLGAVPALLAAVVDWSLATKLRFWIRVGATCCAGYALTVLTGLVLPMLIASMTHASFRDVVVFGLFGAIPAAICSWLSGGKK